MPRVVVALIDCGIARSPALASFVLPGWNAGYASSNGAGNRDDGRAGPLDAEGEACGHGTVMAQSILAAAPGVCLVPLKLLDRDGGLADRTRVAVAFEWILEHRAERGIQLICAALADWGHYRSDEAFCDTPLARAIAELRALGVATVMPAGNAFRMHRKWGAQGMAWPAILREVVSVGEWTQGRPAGSSQHLHPTEGTGCATTVFAEALPPGGTSGACARVTAAMAMQIAACGPLSVDELLARVVGPAATPDSWPLLSLRLVQ